MPGKLVLVRHGESEWNALGKWTGLTDVGITDDGFRFSRQLGSKLKTLKFDVAYSSVLRRTKETLGAVLEGAEQTDVPTIVSEEINERDYGIYTGMEKEQVRSEIGEEAYLALRRGWDRPIDGGESLKDVYARSVPYYQAHIVPKLLDNQNVLIVAHGNSLRSLVKYIENISDDEISSLEVGHNLALMYEIDQYGHQINKTVENI